jgi:enamine deaminase RidA (YjgF/YER057c/UK114 family)
MAKTIIATANAPAAIGTYSQAVRVGDTVYLSGQIGLDPASMQMVDGIDAQIVRVFENLKAVSRGGGRVAGRHRQAQRLPDRPRQLRQGQ